MKTLIQAVAMVLFASSTAQGQQAVQWRVQDGGNGHWYQFVATETDWPTARTNARNRGGELVSITSVGEGQLLRSLCATPTAWMGAFQEANACEPGCGWRWSDDSEWGFLNWDPQSGEPNDGGCCWPSNEDVGEFRSGNGRWNDYLAHAVLPSLVEWSADCNADGIVDYGQILQGHVPDTNSNGVPDGCECATSPTLPACCTGNLNNDSVVDGSDLGIFLGAWGSCSAACPPDFNRDGVVDGGDLGILLNSWGSCPG
ncbi:MAG: hypothetical protein ACKOHI_12520 [Phycisphaerales bacterium]